MDFKFALIGRPLAKSFSPWIHQQFAKQFGLNISYEKIEANEDQSFTAIADAFFQNDGDGCNITVPFKIDALHYADKMSVDAKIASAANTLIHKDDRLIADNTDGAGFIQDAKHNHHFDFENKRVVILGAGGAARGLLFPIINENPKEIIIANRTFDKAENLSDEFIDHFSNIKACQYSNLENQYADILIDATSLRSKQLPLPDTFKLDKKGMCYDLKYSKDPTPTMLWAEKQSPQLILEGSGMLIEQAALSFYLWTGKQPETTPLFSSF
jgi:shikimate dehydrogenase